MKKPNDLSHELVLATDYADTISDVIKGSGVTDLYSTGIRGLDSYLGGGYGKRSTGSSDNEPEIIVLHAYYGVGKTSVGVQLLVDPIRKGVRTGIMSFEVSNANIIARLNISLGGGSVLVEELKENSPRLLPKKTQMGSKWTYEQLLEYIKAWLFDEKYGVDILLIDHLQYVFDTAMSENGDTRYLAEARFAQELRGILADTNKTIILVSQQNRQRDVAGSISIPRIATKEIGIERIKGDEGSSRRALFLKKSRYTPDKIDVPYYIRLATMRVEDAMEEVAYEPEF